MSTYIVMRRASETAWEPIQGSTAVEMDFDTADALAKKLAKRWPLQTFAAFPKVMVYSMKAEMNVEDVTARPVAEPKTLRKVS